MKTNVRWMIAGLPVLATAGIVAVLSGPTPAVAAPSVAGCTTWIGGQDRWAMAQCDTTASYRVVATCEENSGNTYVAYGNWVSNNWTSYAQCHEAAWVIERWVDYA
jgi:hypothetical protein